MERRDQDSEMSGATARESNGGVSPDVLNAAMEILNVVMAEANNESDVAPDDFLAEIKTVVDSVRARRSGDSVDSG